jgi:hypothetical protein
VKVLAVGGGKKFTHSPGGGRSGPAREGSAEALAALRETPRPAFGDPGRGLGAGRGTAHHLDPFLGGEDGPQALPEHGVVVGQVHPYGYIRLSFHMNKVHARRSHGDRPRQWTGQSPHSTRTSPARIQME